MKILLPFLAAASIAAVPVVASAAHCKDAKGKFAKCGSPGAKPA
ncbi:hypothetical protein ACGGKE_04985 [Sphingobium naphthae]